ncbi:hypothetical protein IC620_14825 [Hazenella sp. IB182357]|uniref:Uncharacterized protein n=1 Tax=Polycladospora coralii TaxID=2771432 RepID=A0A926RV01_9BACL|nr:hypothetical protein [Polycladospora coralii]MBD1373618.1 hypothetical protein [Polycladospora coralii]MBS7529660.1 hypothetical protein [Polycladospora coralii]
MQQHLRRWFILLLSYIMIIVMAVAGYLYYENMQTKRYIRAVEQQGGLTYINEISNTYKSTIEMYSNYKLNKERKAEIVVKLNELRKKLEQVEQQVEDHEIDHPINYAAVYHDMKLVNVILTDFSNDEIIPIVVLHAIEGIGDLKKEITYIEYR